MVGNFKCFDRLPVAAEQSFEMYSSELHGRFELISVSRRSECRRPSQI
jgi:hypothetical protein